MDRWHAAEAAQPAAPLDSAGIIETSQFAGSIGKQSSAGEEDQFRGSLGRQGQFPAQGAVGGVDAMQVASLLTFLAVDEVDGMLIGRGRGPDALRRLRKPDFRGLVDPRPVERVPRVPRDRRASKPRRCGCHERPCRRTA